MKSKDKKVPQRCFLRKKKNNPKKILWKQFGANAHMKDLAIQRKKMVKKEIKFPYIV